MHTIHLSWHARKRWPGPPLSKGINVIQCLMVTKYIGVPDSKVHGAHMGLTWGRQDPGGPHVGHVNLALWGVINSLGPSAHICDSKLIITGSDNDLSPGRHQAIIWTNDGILLIGPLGTNFSEILFEIHIFSFKKIHLKMSSGNWRPFRLGLNVLSSWHLCRSDTSNKPISKIF